MISLEPVLILAGLVFAGFAIATFMDKAHPRRYANASFYGLLAISFLFGSHLSDLINGFLALGLILIGGAWGLGRSNPKTTTAEEREVRAVKYKSWLFLPALLIPVSALLGSTVFKGFQWQGHVLIDPKAATLVWLYMGIGLGLALAMVLFRSPLRAPVNEGRRLMDTVGWALLLPQMLAALGAVFTISGVGQQVGVLVSTYLPLTTPLAAVLVFGLGMVLFTIIMGNAFAAFPVMMAAIGLPLVVKHFGGDVVALSSIGMLTGFCGTLLTPMAANFNMVPSALLELKDRYGVIRAQAPTALLLIGVNLILLYAVVYR